MAFTMPTTNQFLGAAGNMGGLLGGFSSWQNPANSANQYMNQIPGTMSPYYQPYINAGNQALPQLQGQYSNLMNNPAGMISSIGSQYQASPGYNWQVGQATKAANQAAAAGGMVGSPQEQQQLAGTVTGLANQDYYNYLNNALGMYGTGLSGTQNLANMGYGASNELAQSLGNALQTQAQLGYAGQTAQNQSNGGFWGGLGTVASDLFGWL